MLGIGGIGMAGVALLLASKGCGVSGCDASSPRTLDWLSANGITLYNGHSPDHAAEDVDWAIRSPAVHPDNPEIQEMHRRGIPIFLRGQVLPVLAEKWQTIAVAGTHGKTSTSSMLTHLLKTCGVSPSWCIGGELHPDGAPAGCGTSDWLVIEADESDATLANYSPYMAVVTNIEFDHMEFFKNEETMRRCFDQFARQTSGPVIGCAEDDEARRLALAHPHGKTYGFREDAHYRATDLRPTPSGTHALFRLPDDQAYPCFIPLPGRHNVLNALAAWTAAVDAGLPPEQAAAALASFRLPRRRLEEVVEAGGIRVLADYAHHPSEIRALLDAVRQTGAGRILAVFQPHRYTRTKILGPDFPPAFEGVDSVILAPVYPASEPPLDGGTSEDLLSHFAAHPSIPVEPAADLPDAARRLLEKARAGDTLLLIGAGDIEQLGPILKTKFESHIA